MEKRNFFGTEGLTSTSATHVAELCNNYCDEAKKILESCRFFDKKISLLSGGEPRTVSVGWGKDKLDAIPELLNTVIEANSLCAWLKEAVKEREKLYNDALSFKYTASRVELEERKPVQVKTKTEADIISEWSVGEQEKYLSLQTKCAVIGKFIHKNSPFYTAKDAMLSAQSNPITVTGTGAESIVAEYILSIPVEDVTAMESFLQAEHRSAQAELNGMKNKIEQEIRNDNLTKVNDYRLAMEAYEQQRERLEREEAEERQRLTDKVSALRILIPNNLLGIYKKVTGK